MLPATPILASAVEPTTLLVTGLIVLVLVIVVGELASAVLRGRARKKGRAGVALVVREDPSAVVPDDVETKDMDVGLRASETALDLQAQPQPQLQSPKKTTSLDAASLDAAKPEEDGNLFDDDKDAAAAIDELNRALEDAQREEEEPPEGGGGIEEEEEFDSENLAALQSELEAEEEEAAPGASAPASVSEVDGPPEGDDVPTEAPPRDETQAFPFSHAYSPADDASGFDVVLEQRPPDEARRLDAIRIVRGLGGQRALFEVMQLIDSAPACVARNLPRAEAETAIEALSQAGLEVRLTEHVPEPEPPGDEISQSGEKSTTTADEEAPSEVEPSDAELEAMAARARQKGKRRKTKKTFAEYEEDRRRLLAKRAAEKAERQARWRERLKQEVLYVGRGVSAGLVKREIDREKLRRFELPELGSAEDVCTAIEISPTQMRWLCFHREDAEAEHYARFTIPKRSGGEREISSPKPLLRKAQRWILENVLAKVAVSEASHGFRAGRGTRSNAEQHLRPGCLIKLDVRDFFPTITFPRIKGLFHRSLGFGEAAATVMALLCTEPPRVTAELDGQQYRVAVGKRQLPQGACTSPALTNIVCRRLDARLQGLAKKFGFRYTRYADDITISGPTGERNVVGQLIGGAKRILKEEGFEAHDDKISVHRPARQQRVTGIVVNEKLSLDRRHVRRLRAILHDTLHNGPEKANRDNHPNFFGWLQGHVAYLHMIDPERAKPFREQLEQIRTTYFAADGS